MTRVTVKQFTRLTAESQKGAVSMWTQDNKSAVQRPDRVSFAVSIPQSCPDRGFDAEAFRSYMERAESLGFDGAWAMEQTLGPRPHLSPLEALTYAASCTERLRLGCSVFVTPMHIPVQLAKAIATVDQMSHGRVDVGVGIGGTSRPLSAFGIGPERLAARYNEGLRLMKGLWAGSPIQFDGDFWKLDGTGIAPGSWQKPHPPIWLGGSHPRALSRAAQEGDGFFGAGTTTTAAFSEHVALVKAELTQAGRDPQTFPVAKRIYVAIDDNRETARHEAQQGLDATYPGVPIDLLPVAVHGTPEDCAQGVQDVIDAGANLVLFTPFAREHEHMERIAAEVIPLTTRA